MALRGLDIYLEKIRVEKIRILPCSSDPILILRLNDPLNSPFPVVIENAMEIFHLPRHRSTEVPGPTKPQRAIPHHLIGQAPKLHRNPERPSTLLPRQLPELTTAKPFTP